MSEQMQYSDAELVIRRETIKHCERRMCDLLIPIIVSIDPRLKGQERLLQACGDRELLDQLAMDMQYVALDLEATRRERDELKRILEESE